MNTVTIACKLPHGLICELGLILDAGGHGMIRGPNYKSVTLRGTNTNKIVMPGAIGACVPIDALPGITENVDEEFITEWLRRNAALTFVKNGLVAIVKSKPEEVKAVSLDLQTHRHGMESLDPAKMPPKLAPADR
jgi:hypothetical protein